MLPYRFKCHLHIDWCLTVCASVWNNLGDRKLIGLYIYVCTFVCLCFSVCVSYCTAVCQSVVSRASGPEFSQLPKPPGVCCTSPSETKHLCSLSKLLVWSQCKTDVSCCVLNVVTRLIIMSTGLTLMGLIRWTNFFTWSKVGRWAGLGERQRRISCGNTHQREDVRRGQWDSWLTLLNNLD